MSSIAPGKLVYWKDSAVIVMELKGFKEAIVRNFVTNETSLARVSDLSTSLSSNTSESSKSRHLLASDKEWELAVERYEVIKPLLDLSIRTENDVKEVADRCGKGITTVYRWLRRFEETGLVSSLLRQSRSDKGVTKLDSEVEELIEAQIRNVYLQPERPTVLKLYRIIKAECVKSDLPVPDKNTIYSRARAIDNKEATKRRLGPKAAKQAYKPILGRFPGADFPNAVVQIDHTPMDVIIVDDLHRLPIGRPYLTIAIDVATKMISGFCMTLEHPSSLSAGLCVGQAILSKDHWLATRSIDVEWPIYGKMQKIHVDNAKEFRGNMLRRACQQHDIILEYRPKGQPNYGPHVERAFRTFMQEVQDLPGTTFSNVKDKLDYDSEGHACMTLTELELWFTVFIVYYYHHKPHRGLSKTPPIKKYQEFIFGTKDTPGIGLPMLVDDEETLRLDFTPYIERTIQRQGVIIDHIQYYSPVLRKWIGAKREDDRTKARKFIFARDPRDISVVYFLDPDSEKYVPVPYLDTRRPSISLWELRAAVKSVGENDHELVTEEMIFRGVERMREIEADAVEKTRLAKQQRASEKRKRRMAQRREGWKGVHDAFENGTPEVIVEQEHSVEDDDIQPFDDVVIS